MINTVMFSSSGSSYSKDHVAIININGENKILVHMPYGKYINVVLFVVHKSFYKL